ncbi:MAG TPA: carbon storage regulator [Candidatus Tyrphobacter sp.]
MLCLNRKAHESIRIGEDILIVVMDVNAAGVVKLGIEAPKDVKVLRSEVYEKDRSTDPSALSS